MSTHIAEEAYPGSDDGLGMFRATMMRAFDRGAVEALKIAAERYPEYVDPDGFSVRAELLDMAAEWAEASGRKAKPVILVSGTGPVSLTFAKGSVA